MQCYRLIKQLAHIITNRLLKVKRNQLITFYVTLLREFRMFPFMSSRILILNVLIANRKKRKTANGTDLLQLVHSSLFLTPYRQVLYYQENMVQRMCYINKSQVSTSKFGFKDIRIHVSSTFQNSAVWKRLSYFLTYPAYVVRIFFLEIQ